MIIDKLPVGKKITFGYIVITLILVISSVLLIYTMSNISDTLNNMEHHSIPENELSHAAQEKISKFSDSILEDVKTKNAGEVGDLLANLVSQIKSFSPLIIHGVFVDAARLQNINTRGANAATD